MRRFILCVVVVFCGAEMLHSKVGALGAPRGNPQSENGQRFAFRYGRAVARAVAGDRHRVAKIEDVEAPTLVSGRTAVSCLAYFDDKRLFVEVVIRNAGAASSIGTPLVVVKQGDRTLQPFDLSRVAHEIHSAAVRDFVPIATATDPQSGRPTYDNAAVDRQIKRHLQTQEREENFALLLTALAHDPPKTALASGGEHTSMNVFKRPDGSFDVDVNVSAERVRFRFERPEDHTGQRP